MSSSQVEVWNRTRSVCLGDRVQVAADFWSRLRGLLGRSGLEKGEGLVITPCNSIHTFFMAFAIDVVFIDRDGRVVALFERLGPWKLTRIYFDAASVIELPAGSLLGTGTEVGDVIAQQAPSHGARRTPPEGEKA